MNSRLVIAAVGFVIASAAALISKARSKKNDEVESEEEIADGTGSDSTRSTEQYTDSESIDQFESTEQKESWDAHKKATQRTPPVELGEVHKLGVEEIIDHHSGKQQARGRIEGFHVFVSDVPNGIRPLDLIRVKIMSYGRGRTSAEAKFLEQV
ncbi:hypothetical protein ACLI4Q_05595 [Natrialbaceae archaeon A-CW1-1]